MTYRILKIYFFLSCLLNIDAFLGPYRPIRLNDHFDSRFVAIKTSLASLLTSGLPGWEPSTIAGNQALLLGLSPLNPFSLLTGILPLWAIYSIWLIMACGIAGIGMFLFLNRGLNVADRPSHISAFLFMLFSLDQLFIEHTFNFAFPFFLYVFHRQMDHGNKTKYFLFYLALFFSSSAPYTMPYFPPFHLIIILFLVRPLSRLISHLFGFLLIWTSFALIHLPTIYSLLSEIPTSHRLDFASSLGTAAGWTSCIRALMEVLRSFPTSYVILLAIASFTLFKLNERKIYFWWVLLSSMILLIIIDHSHLGRMIFEQLGLFKGMSRERIFHVSYNMILSILAAYGVEALIESFTQHQKSSLYKIILPIVLSLVVMPFILLLIHDRPWMFPAALQLKTFFYTIFVILILLYLLYVFILNRWNFWCRLALPCLYGLGLFLLIFSKYEYLQYHGLKNFNHYFQEKNISQLSDDHPKKYLFRTVINHGRWISGHHTFLEYHGFQTADGYQVAYPLRFKKFWMQMANPNIEGAEKWKNDFNTWGSRIYLPYFSNAKSEFNIPLLSLLNVKYIVSAIDIKNLEEKNLSLYLPARTQMNPNYFNDRITYWVYENKSVLPKTFIVPTSKVFDHEEDLLKTLNRSSAEDHLKQTLLLSSDISDIEIPPPALHLHWKADIIEYKPNSIKIEGHTSEKSILILTENFHKNWKAYVNNIPTSVLPAYYTLRGVIVPQGKFWVEFKYEDHILRTCYLVIPFAIILLFSSGWIVKIFKLKL